MATSTTTGRKPEVQPWEAGPGGYTFGTGMLEFCISEEVN